jgi:hypothetical protein
MAMSLRNNPSAATNKSTSSDDTSWKSQAFFNFRLPLGKVGKIGLKLSDPNQKELIEWLQADGANLDKFIDGMTISYSHLGAPRKAVVGFVTGEVKPVAPVEGKAVAYINVDVKVAGGGTTRFGGLPLYEDQQCHRELMAGLGHADEAIRKSNMEWMGSEMDVTFEMAEKKRVKFACMQ